MLVNSCCVKRIISCSLAKRAGLISSSWRPDGTISSSEPLPFLFSDVREPLKLWVARMVVKMAPFSFLRALNFLNPSNVAWRWKVDATSRFYKQNNQTRYIIENIKTQCCSSYKLCYFCIVSNNSYHMNNKPRKILFVQAFPNKIAEQTINLKLTNQILRMISNPNKRGCHILMQDWIQKGNFNRRHKEQIFLFYKKKFWERKRFKVWKRVAN